MRRSAGAVASLLVCLSALLGLAACGKRGNPLPPLQRVPAAPGEFAVTRVDQDVRVHFIVPATNIDGASPADVARVEVYALTFDGAANQLSALAPETLRRLATLVAAEPVRRPVPPPPPVREGMPPVPMPPPEPGADQGASVVVRERLEPDVRTPVTAPSLTPQRAEDAEPLQIVPPAVAPWDTGLLRYYFAVAVSPRGRYGPHTGLAPAPLGPTSSAPSRPAITYTENSMTLRWTPPSDARGAPASAPEEELLPSRSLVPAPPPTQYQVYEVPPGQPAGFDEAAPLSPDPIAATELTIEEVTLGRERCFYVSAVDVVDGIHVRGPASPLTCASFADTFPPAPPRDLVAVAVPGAINLIWDASESPDAAGYLVLRGEVGSATLTPLGDTPIATLSYRDETASAGTRYVYAVVAVDAAGNRSAESNRVEETAQ